MLADRRASYADVIDRSMDARVRWCELVVLSLLPRLAKLGIKQTGPGPQRQIRCAVLPMEDHRYAEFWSSLKSTTGKTNLISLSIDHDRPLEVVHSLCHEVLHALVDCKDSGKDGHGGRWRKFADVLGFEGPGDTITRRPRQRCSKTCCAKWGPCHDAPIGEMAILGEPLNPSRPGEAGPSMTECTATPG